MVDTTNTIPGMSPSPGRPLPAATLAALANPQVASGTCTCGLSHAWDRLALAVAELDAMPKPNPGQADLAFLRRAQRDLARQIEAARPCDPVAGAALKVRAALALLPRSASAAAGLLRAAQTVLDDAVTDAALALSAVPAPPQACGATGGEPDDFDVATLLQRWRAASARMATAKTGREEAQALLDVGEIEERLADTPAVDVAGAIAKLEVAQTLAADDGWGWHLVGAVLEDLRALAAPAPATA